MVISGNLISSLLEHSYLRTIHSGRHRKVCHKILFSISCPIKNSDLYHIKRKLQVFIDSTCTHNSNGFSLCDDSRKPIPRTYTK